MPSKHAASANLKTAVSAGVILTFLWRFLPWTLTVARSRGRLGLVHEPWEAACRFVPRSLLQRDLGKGQRLGQCSSCGGVPSGRKRGVTRGTAEFTQND